MLPYLLRRLLYAIPILVGVNLLTFALFFVAKCVKSQVHLAKMLKWYLLVRGHWIYLHAL